MSSRVVTISAHRPRSWARTISTGLLVAAAAMLVVGLLAAFGSERLGYDFRASYLPAAEAVLDGDSPYPGPDGRVLEQERGYVYPPLLAVALAPFARVSFDIAALLAVLVAGGAIAAALLLVGVRDIRCYAAAFVSAPVWNALEMANVSALLALALALLWRYRDDAPRAGLALGVALAAKLLVWPLLVWSSGTRRLPLTFSAVSVAVVGVLLPWAVIAFAGLGRYVDVLQRVTEIQAGKSYSSVGMANALGLGETFGHVVGVVVGVLLLLWCVGRARRGDDVAAFALALAAALVLAPIVWQHSLVLLFVPLGIARPGFSLLWLLPVVLWLSPRAGHGEGLEPFLPALVAAVLLAASLVPSSRRRSAA